MFYKGYVIGASFSRGLALHFYDRVKRNKKCNYDCNYMEHLFNYKNSFADEKEKQEFQKCKIPKEMTLFSFIKMKSFRS